MLSSVIDKLRRDAVYPELAGHRVLLTGACCDFGVDIARSFAEHDAKLIVQLGAQSPEMLSLGQILAETARDLQIFERPLLDSEAATRFLQGPAQTTFGGLELVINLVQITPDDLVGRFELDEIEDLIAEKLTPATIIGRIAANRMRLTMTDGLILNVIAAPNCRTPQEMALVDMLRATLAAMTRREAQVWGEQGIRINAVQPASPSDQMTGARSLLSGEAGVAALALYLASSRGAELNGCVFDAANIGGF